MTISYSLGIYQQPLWLHRIHLDPLLILWQLWGLIDLWENWQLENDLSLWLIVWNLFLMQDCIFLLKYMWSAWDESNFVHQDWLVSMRKLHPILRMLWTSRLRAGSKWKSGRCGVKAAVMLENKNKLKVNEKNRKETLARNRIV